MNKDKLKLWIDALRSGNYAQTEGYLAARKKGADEVSYCCLGVACEVAIKDGVIFNVVTESDDVDRILYSYDGEDQHTPAALREWLGVDETPEVPVDGCSEPVSVIGLNDDLHWNFGQIADALEATFLKEDK